MNEVWGERHSVARKSHACDDCGHLIPHGVRYWRSYGRMAEASAPWTARFCEPCEAKWHLRYGPEQARP